MSKVEPNSMAKTSLGDDTNSTIEFIQSIFSGKSFIPLHEPYFHGNEKKYVVDCIDSTFVSSVGQYVDRFEKMMAEFTGAKYAIATTNGTSALHVALKLVGVKADEEVITQPLTFIATCNAISYAGARPVFVDVDRETLGMSPESLQKFFQNHTELRGGQCFNKKTQKRIACVVPMHTFGHCCRILEIKKVCDNNNVPLVEDAAESLGSYSGEVHTGRFGQFGVFSYNGNKTITTGGGGMIITDDADLARQAKHITTTSKKPHPYEYVHDEVGYNYRLPNINAALGCAQMEQLPAILKIKRELAQKYITFFASSGIEFIAEPKGTHSNYWLCAVFLKNLEARNSFLELTNQRGVMTRPVWRLMNHLEMYKNCFAEDLQNAEWIEQRLVNIPSSCYRTEP
jgi:perosamine synthetase